MTDGFAMLEHDHRAVGELFDDYEQRGDTNLAKQICFELTVHDEVEQQVLYPTLRSFGDRTEEMADQAETAHTLIMNLVGRIRAVEPDQRLRYVRELRNQVDSHVREEETDIFPELRDLGVYPEELGRSVEAAKGEAIARSSGQVG